MEPETLFVNFFAGPGASKSSSATNLFSRLKARGFNAEYIHEFAKDLTWTEDFQTLKCQPYVTATQMYKQYRLMGKVEIAVCDSPILLGIIYQGFGCTDSWNQSIVDQFNLFRNLNIYLKRNPSVHKYNPKGRNQTEQESMEIDGKVKDLLNQYNIPFIELEVQEDFNHIDDVLNKVNSLLREPSS